MAIGLNGHVVYVQCYILRKCEGHVLNPLVQNIAYNALFTVLHHLSEVHTTIQSRASQLTHPSAAEVCEKVSVDLSCGTSFVENNCKAPLKSVRRL